MSNVSYVSVVCGMMNSEGGNMYSKAKHSLSSIFRMINALYSFFLRFLRYVCRTGAFLFFFTKSTKTVLKKKTEMSA